VTLKPEINVEFSTLWIHTSKEHNFFQEDLFRKVLSIKNNSVVNNLTIKDIGCCVPYVPTVGMFISSIKNLSFLPTGGP
jgi:hypothetical protein